MGSHPGTSWSDQTARQPIPCLLLRERIRPALVDVRDHAAVFGAESDPVSRHLPVTGTLTTNGDSTPGVRFVKSSGARPLARNAPSGPNRNAVATTRDNGAPLRGFCTRPVITSRCGSCSWRSDSSSSGAPSSAAPAACPTVPVDCRGRPPNRHRHRANRDITTTENADDRPSRRPHGDGSSARANSVRRPRRTARRPDFEIIEQRVGGRAPMAGPQRRRGSSESPTRTRGAAQDPASAQVSAR